MRVCVCVLNVNAKECLSNMSHVALEFLLVATTQGRILHVEMALACSVSRNDILFERLKIMMIH